MKNYLFLITILITAGCASGEEFKSDVINNNKTNNFISDTIVDNSKIKSDFTSDSYLPPPNFSKGVQTLAGSSKSGNDDGNRNYAKFNDPVNVLILNSGELLVADYNNGLIRLIDNNGNVSTVSPKDEFIRPFGMAVIDKDNIYVQTDQSFKKDGNFDGALWKLNIRTKTARIVFDHIKHARGIAVLPNNNLVMTVYNQHCIQLFNPKTLRLQIIAGWCNKPGYVDGVRMNVRFNQPYDIVCEDYKCFIADKDNNVLRILSVNSGIISTFAGDGVKDTVDAPLKLASFNRPQALAMDKNKNIYVTEIEGYFIRKIDRATGLVYTVAGNGKMGFKDSPNHLQAMFYGLEGLDVSPDGNVLYLSDGDRGDDLIYHRIRRIQF